MDLSLLETMRYKIMTGTDFSEIFNYFFDHFGENIAFIDASLPTPPQDNPMLTQLLGRIGGALFKTNKVRLDDLHLLKIAEYNFIHGGFIMNGCMGTVLYCEDAQKGILAIHRPKEKMPSQFARFTAEMLPSNLAKEAEKFNQ